MSHIVTCFARFLKPLQCIESSIDSTMECFMKLLSYAFPILCCSLLLMSTFSSRYFWYVLGLKIFLPEVRTLLKVLLLMIASFISLCRVMNSTWKLIAKAAKNFTTLSVCLILTALLPCVLMSENDDFSGYIGY